MKQVIIATITFAVGVGAAALVLTRSTARRKHRRPMTFLELQEDNLYTDDGLFD